MSELAVPATSPPRASPATAMPGTLILKKDLTMTLKYYHAEPAANSLKSMIPLVEKAPAGEDRASPGLQTRTGHAR